MPKLDRMGPLGRGPMTGRGAGCCAEMPHGDGHGWRGGRRRRRQFDFGRVGRRAMPDAAELADVATVEAPISTAERRQLLKAERNRLKAALSEVEAALRRLGPPSGDSDAAVS